ncbi:glycosyltransferase family 4 protein [Phenylobacterium soli]|uniref:Glycosyltransferase n=1 Tax=Phenylobacterium soli TaxID=2170551 RepID=A0A328AJJ5_9CAUL|nr:glycosyltransferase family 4 protein [Phenylobacterium soli]RAK55042.1 hypothetical protein DJ017_11190 [Phenylobacterium soli]
MRRTLVINWNLTSFHGWGIYGLNLALNLANDPDLQVVPAHEISQKMLALDPLSQMALEPTIRAASQLVRQLAANAGQEGQSTGPMLHALTAELVSSPAAHNVRLRGKPNLAVLFLETDRLPADAVARGHDYDRIVAGSTWNEELLRAHGLEKITTVLQGVDPALFHPAPRRGFLSDRFLVFSGGKLERRKGQDIALAAFKIFAERHPDALLVTAWHSPFPHVARTVDASGLAAPVRFRPDGAVDAFGWAVANGVRENQILDIGLVPNAAMPQILREMDVALFPNRCEGGTNLVAMEAMACGVPAILSRNTGHLDLIEEGNCYVLERQGPVKGEGVERPELSGWRESDVDEAVEALEAAYQDREEARRRGLAGAATLSRLTWAATAQGVKAAVQALI